MTETIIAYGLSTEGPCEPEPLARELALFAESGCTAAEISLQNGFAVTGGRVNVPEVEALASVLRRFPLRYTVHGPLGMNLMDAAHHDLHRAVCRAMIEATGALGAGVLVVHSGVWERGLAPAEIERRKRMEVEALRDLGEVAARHGVMLALENLPPLPHIPETHDAWGIAAQVAAAAHPQVGATLDIGHAAMMAAAKQQDLAASIAAMAPHVVHLHLQDQFGRLDTIRLPGSGEKLAYGTGDLHAPPGWGEIPFEQLLAGLTPRAGTVMIYELAAKFFRFVPETAAALRRFAATVGAARQAA
ncbi:sugar phosphate isomerase/epimerase [Elioraea tepidiphila]|jgi:sugar phosphate isomerase/epimerase|uniref:sugar phosphate isomerase/epimerase family protein n=1 Tax=Elioraea tepidiphila TaxID=457934 RepID=UPI00036F554F|nr:sugar phosphate isomerase/epimerase family protein [Elioraea tepidiphila]